jgi:uncharacterized SAM-binding protein YcdF (DUF218 family)
MATESLTTNPEQIITSPDLLIVLGKNIGIASGPEKIRSNRRQLSHDSRLNVLAAGLLYKNNPGMKIILSGGKTAGPNNLSEAEAMKEYLMTRFPDIPDDDIETEDFSIDTTTNAQEIEKMLHESEHPYEHIGLLTVGYHMRNASRLFKTHGVPIEQKFAAEDVLRDNYDSDYFQKHLNKWDKTPRVRAEKFKEMAKTIILSLDSESRLLHTINRRTRK